MALFALRQKLVVSGLQLRLGVGERNDMLTAKRLDSLAVLDSRIFDRSLVLRGQRGQRSGMFGCEG